MVLATAQPAKMPPGIPALPRAHMFPAGAAEPSGSAGWKHAWAHGSEAAQSPSLPVTPLIDTVKEATSSCPILTGSVIEFSPTSPLQPPPGGGWQLMMDFFLALGISPRSHSFYLMGSVEKSGSSKSPTPVPYLSQKCLVKKSAWALKERRANVRD